MKISTLFVSLTIGLAVSLFLLSYSSAEGGTIIYSEDFSSNPSWITNNSTHFYWDQAGGRYHYKIIDNTSEYAYHPLDLMDRSFQVIFDICPTITTLCGDNRVGISDANMSYISPTSITVYMSNINSDHFITMVVNDNLGRSGGCSHSGHFTDGVTYRVTINYDKLTNDVSVKVTERETGVSVYECTVTGYGPFLGMDRIFMASIGDWACPGRYGEGYIDNVVVTVNPGGASCDPQADIMSEYDPDDCTIALWHLDEGSGGTAYDASSNNIDGTIYGASWTSQGKFNGTLNFDGLDDYIMVPNNPSLNSMSQLTVEAWVYLDHYPTIGHSQLVVQKEGTYHINIRYGVPYFSVCNGNSPDYLSWGYDPIFAQNQLPLHQWTHLAGTFDKATKEMKFYVDGNLEGAKVFSNWTNWYPGHNLYIGCNRDIYNEEYFPGKIDEVRISNVVRTFAPLGPIVYDTGFRPSSHGFYFTNGDFIIGRCLGMTYAAAYYFDRNSYPIPDNPDCNGPGTISCGDWCPLPSPSSPLYAYITALQAKIFISATLASIIRWMENPIDPSHFFEHHYGLIKDYLSEKNFPRPIFVSRNGGQGHALLVYKIEDYGNTKKLYVYDSNGPECENCYLELEVVNGEWIMHDYDCNGNFSTRHNLFAALRPMNKYLDSPLGVILLCPVQLEVDDSRGNRINKDVNDFDEAVYLEDDINGDGDTDKVVLFDFPEPDRYTIHVTPVPGASGTDSFTILTTFASDTLLFLQNIKISQIPAEGFCFWTNPVGSLSGTVSASSGGLLGVTLDIYDSSGTLWQSVVTNDSGYYHIDSIPNGNYAISVVTPLGYQADQETKEFTIHHSPVVGIDFSLTKLDIAPSPRSRAYWAHQLAKALQNKPQDYTLAHFSTFAGLINAHFNQNQVNPVDFYSVSQPATQQDSLMKLKNLLHMCQGEEEPFLKRFAKAQLMSLMLNVVSGKIGQTEEISADGRTVSQAVTYCDMLVNDEIDCPDNVPGHGSPLCPYILADFILTFANLGLTVPNDMIPADVVQIAYRIYNQENLPVGFALHQNYPNPFNPECEIAYDLPKDCHVTLTIYNILGQRVKILVGEYQNPGNKTVSWDSKDDQGQEVGSGIYFYRLEAGDFTQTRKMVLMK